MTTTSTITPELLDQLLANYKKPEDLTGEDGLFKQLKKALIERALGAELSEHLGYEKGDPAGRAKGSSCESPLKGKLTETSLHIVSDTLPQHTAHGLERLCHIAGAH